MATHYVLGSAATDAAAEPVANRGELGDGLSTNRGELEDDRGELDRHELGVAYRAPQLAFGQSAKT